MSTFVIGDIHGEFDSFMRLLEHVQFDPQEDTLWTTGDLINRGKKSLEVIEFAMSLDNMVTVLGNHDVFFIALYYGYSGKVSKVLQPLFDAPNVQEIVQWLSTRPFVHHSKKLNSVLVHAGLPPPWSLSRTLEGNRYLMELFSDSECLKPFLLDHMMGNEPRYWEDSQDQYDEYRYLINCFTRMRYCDRKGAPRFKNKMLPSDLPPQDKEQLPWYEYPKHSVIADKKVLFGHWATLADYKIDTPNVFHLDTGCAWGGNLSAICLDGCLKRKFATYQRFSVPCQSSE